MLERRSKADREMAEPPTLPTDYPKRTDTIRWLLGGMDRYCFHRTVIRFCLAAAVMLGLAACSSSSFFSAADAKTPLVSLAGLSFSEPGLFEQGLTIQLRIKNPNDFDIPVDGLNFALDVNRTSFAQGVTDQNFTLPSLSEIVVPVDITVPTDDLIKRVVTVGTGKRLDYKLRGTADIDSWFGASVPFVREGKLALPNLPGLTDKPPHENGTS